MKYFLQDKGIQGIIGPKDATKQAFQKEIITEGQIWIDMIESRNKTVHTYLKEILEKEYNLIIHSYYPLFEAFHHKMNILNRQNNK